MDEIKEKLLNIIDDNIELDTFMDETFLSFVYNDDLYSYMLEKLEVLNVYIKMRLYEIKYYVLNHEIDLELFKDISIIVDLLLDLPNKYLEKFVKCDDKNKVDIKNYLDSHNQINVYIKKLGINN